MMMKYTKILAAGAFALLSGAQAHAAAVLTLGDLINTNGSITVGDKVFSNFAYTGSGNVPVAALINVTGGIFSGNIGLKFEGNWSTISPVGDDSIIAYTVTVTDPDFKIIGAVVSSDASVVGGFGYVSITDSFSSPNDNDTITSFIAVPGNTQLTSTVNFASPVSVLDATKDIQLGAFGGLAQLTTIFQTYIQQGPDRTPTVPTPAALPMGLVGLVGIVLARRRR